MFPAWCSVFGSGGKFKSPKRWSVATWVTLGACGRAQLKFLGNLHSTCQRPRTVCFTPSRTAICNDGAQSLRSLGSGCRCASALRDQPQIRSVHRVCQNRPLFRIRASTVDLKIQLRAMQSTIQQRRFSRGANYRCSAPLPTPGLSATLKLSTNGLRGSWPDWYREVLVLYLKRPRVKIDRSDAL
jgi:hypothetical protein